MGAVLSVAVPAPAARAASSDAKNFFASCAATAGNAQITVKYDCDMPESVENILSIFLYDRANATIEELTESPQGDLMGVGFLGYGGKGSYTFTELVNGKTYYVYMSAALEGKEMPLYYLGAFTPIDPEEGAQYMLYLKRVEEQILCAEPGGMIEMEKGTLSVNNAIMKALLERGDVSLKLEYVYEGEEYVVVIPAGQAVDSDIPWYGPLYLAARYGNRMGSIDEDGSLFYTVKSGDCLSGIAAANGMTLAQLAAKNPRISDLNKIAVGQKIFL